MGLLKDLPGDKVGVTATYHHIVSFNMNKASGSGTIVVAGYVDKQARDTAENEGKLRKGAVLTNRFTVSGQDFLDMYTDHLQNGTLVPVLMYDYIQNLEGSPYKDAVNDHTEF